MPNPNPLALPLSLVTQGILRLSENGMCEGNHIIATSLRQPILYALICNSHNILTVRQHINDMVIPDVLILQDLLVSKLRWMSRSVWYHDTVCQTIELSHVTVHIRPLRCSGHTQILLRYRITIVIHQYIIDMFANNVVRRRLQGRVQK